MIEKSGTTIGGLVTPKAKSLLRWAANKAGAKVAGTALDTVSGLKRSRRGPLAASNWYERAALVCESVGDTMLHDKPGAFHRLVIGLASQIGMAGMPASIFSSAGLVGAASTGTAAISSLSSAAVSSMTLASAGGSVAVGGVVLGLASAAAGFGAVLGAGWIARKYLYGTRRDKTSLDDQEARILDGALALALAFRNEVEAGRTLHPVAARALYSEALKPLCDALLEYQVNTTDWPVLARKRYAGAMHALAELASFALQHARAHQGFTTGKVEAVMLLLLADELPVVGADERRVMEALQRLNSAMSEATDAELARWAQGLDPQALRALCLSLRRSLAERKDADSRPHDAFLVEFVPVDEVADRLTDLHAHEVRITNHVTGEVRELSLDGASYRAFIEHFNARFAARMTQGMDEAVQGDAREQSDASEAQDSHAANLHADPLKAIDDPVVTDSLAAAGMITLARNLQVLLTCQQMTQKQRQALVRRGEQSAVAAGMVIAVTG